MFDRHPLVDVMHKDLKTDIAQMAEEGHDVAALTAELEEVHKGGSLEALSRLQTDLWNRPSPPGFPYEEPNDWEAISSSFPDPESHARFAGTEEDLADRLLAAWRGRCAGCQLGKPLEGTAWPEKIKQVLETVGSWPLDDYMNPTPRGMKVEDLPDCDFFRRRHAWRNTLCRGNFDHAARDDDIDYSLVGLAVLEGHGPGFTSAQSVATILGLMPLHSLYAAGRNMFRVAAFGVPTPSTAVMGNPCRQSLGAQIRCDPFGWCAPANPALAARMAYTDAVNSQTRNGIYSGVFFAVLMADVLAHGDPARAIDTAERYVPPRSRFAEMIRFMKDECGRADDWEAINGRMIARYRREAERFNHSIPNAAIVLLGLLKGGGDFTRTVGIAVMGGLDTDCNGATAGSIMGCALGTRGIESRWTDPFHDSVHANVKGQERIRISEVARRTYEVATQNVRR